MPPNKKIDLRSRTSKAKDMADSRLNESLDERQIRLDIFSNLSFKSR